MARSLTVPLTARSRCCRRGRNSGAAPTYESVENARRAPPGSSTAESPRPDIRALPYAAKTCSTSSADSAPPPPCPMTTTGWSRCGAGRSQSAGSTTVSTVSASGVHLLAVRGAFHPAVEVVGRAGALAGHHRGARGVRAACTASRTPSTPSAWSDPGAPRRCGCAAGSSVRMPATSKRCSASRVAEGAAVSRHPLSGMTPIPPGPVRHLEHLLDHAERRRVALDPHGHARTRSPPGARPFELAHRAAYALRMSSGSKPVTTMGTRCRSASSGYSAVPITLHTCPAARKPCTRHAAPS